MSYPKQQGVIPEYTGPPPIDIREPENLLDALKQSRDDRVDFFLQNPTEKDEINKSGFNGQRPLHLVCFRGDLSTAKKLLEHGADINAVTKFSETPLLIAVQSGNLALVNYLIENKADISLRDENKKTISHYAVKQQFVGMLHYLMEKQLFDFSARDKFGTTPLLEAVKIGKFDMALEIAQTRPMTINDKDHAGANVIHACAKQGNTQLAWKLLELSSIELLSVTDVDGFTPCQLADSKHTDSCDRGNGNKAGCNSSSHFSRTFKNHLMDTKFASVGPSLQKKSLLLPMKWVLFCFIFSHVISYFIDEMNWWIRIPFLALFFVPLAKMGIREGHRIDHPSGLPNPYFKGFFISTVGCCYLSFFTSVFWALPLSNTLPGLLVQSLLPPFAHLALTRDPFKLSSDHSNDGTALNAGLKAIIASNGQDAYKYCPETKSILPHKAKFCKITRAAYRDFDHHCLFLMKTIARGNHHIFIIFLIFLVANQATYVFITIQYYWRELGYNPAGFESACIFMCFMGSGSMGFLLITQILQVLKGGTQYFPGNGKMSPKNVIEFWRAQTGRLPEDTNRKNHFTV